MKFSLVTVGHRMPAWIDAGFDEYARRLPQTARLELIELKPAARAGGSEKSVRQWLEAEAARIRAALPPRCCKVVLDERGKLSTTAELARRITGWQRDGRDVAFIIGGADGTAPELQLEADLLFSLSPAEARAFCRLPKPALRKCCPSSTSRLSNTRSKKR